MFLVADDLNIMGGIELDVKELQTSKKLNAWVYEKFQKMANTKTKPRNRPTENNMN